MSDDDRPTADSFPSIDTTCPNCGERMRPSQLRSGSLVLRCRACGQITIV